MNDFTVFSEKMMINEHVLLWFTCSRADLTFAYKLLFGYTAVDARDYFTTCNNVNKLLLPRFTTDCQKFSFSTGVVCIWNNLPIDVDFTSVKSFVRAISRINFTIYCDFNVWSDSVL